MEQTTLENTLRQLLELQNFDQKINTIIQLRGELPQEVERLTTNLESRTTIAKSHEENIVKLEHEIAELRLTTKELESKAKRYEAQQMNVKNNREYDAITKEIELNKLDIQLAEKKIKENYIAIDNDKFELEQLDKLIAKNKQRLLEKKEELGQVIKESEEEEALLKQQRQTLAELMDVSLLDKYEKIRHALRNQIAVAVVKGGACTGCFTNVYPQMQAEIKDKKRIFMCENCGRFLVDVETAITILSENSDDLEEDDV